MTEVVDTLRVFEIRSYTAAPGRREALKRRFRDHTLQYFARHGIEVVGFFEPVDSDDDLVYLIAYSSDEEADRAWGNFSTDPEWLAARASTETEGPLVSHIETRRFHLVEDLPMNPSLTERTTGAK